MHKNHCNPDNASRAGGGGGGGKEPHVELESQFIMRLPPEPSRVLREALRNGSSLKDRLSIQLENDLRYGQVKMDHWLLYAKVVDLPTIVESLKTIDNKSFYKTADICQLLVCKEEDDQTSTDEDQQQQSTAAVKQKKKDPIKVDKKYLWPHGITPPTKNVRKRRFRKTLKKKYVEAPEIEKEVKRLLRVDNEAVNVKWEVICEDEDVSKPNIVSSSGTVKGNSSGKIEQQQQQHHHHHHHMPMNETSQSVDVAEHDIFGEAVSDSEEEEDDDDDESQQINVMELDENSRLSVDSRVSDSNSMQVKYSQQLPTAAAGALAGAAAAAAVGSSMTTAATTAAATTTTQDPLVTEFTKDMFISAAAAAAQDIKPDIEDVKIPPIENFGQYEEVIKDVAAVAAAAAAANSRSKQLQEEISTLREQRRQQESAIEKIENAQLLERFQEIIDNLLAEEVQKLQELNELAASAAAAAGQDAT